MKKYSSVIVAVLVTSFLFILFYFIFLREPVQTPQDNSSVAPDGTVLQGPTSPPSSAVRPPDPNQDPRFNSVGPTSPPPASQ